MFENLTQDIFWIVLLNCSCDSCACIIRFCTRSQLYVICHRQFTCLVCVIYGSPRFSQYKHVIDLCKPHIYHHLLFWKHWQIFPIITTYPMKKKLVNVLSPEMVYQLPLLLGISIEVSFRLVKLPLTTKKAKQVGKQIVWAQRRTCCSLISDVIIIVGHIALGSYRHLWNDVSWRKTEKLRLVK